MIPVKAYAAHEAKKPLTPFEFNRRELKPTDVLIDILFCGVCHSDIHSVRNEWKESAFPMVPGHEIIGKIKSLGSEVQGFKLGDSVGVGCMVDSCRTCNQCKEHFEQFCEQGMIGTYNSVSKDGEVTQGGYSTQIVVDQDFVLRIPSTLPLDAAAPLLCAGITLYSPLKHWNAGPGKRVAILGLGGLGHMGVKIARALGAEVSVLSHSSHKEHDAKKLGANKFYSTADQQVFKELKNYFDLIICTVSAKLDWNNYLSLLNRDGSMVVVGIPSDQIPVNAFSLVGARRSLSGSLIGGIKETQEMLDFCAEHEIVSDIELIDIQHINEAFERIVNSDVKYRFVIDMASLKK